MNRFQLYLDTVDVELFRKATCELGTFFYHTLSDESAVEIVYFSGSRIARFHGVADDRLIEFCERFGYEVQSIALDEAAGTVRIIQSKEIEK